MPRPAYVSLLSMAALRLVTSGHRRSAIVIPQAKLAYFRIPKAGNTSVKEALYSILPDRHLAPELPRFRNGTVKGVNKDDFWAEAAPAGVMFETPEQYLKRTEALFSFTVVRNPFSRMVSAYFEKVRLPRQLFEPFRPYGITKDTDFPGFVRRIARLPDIVADVHVRSQASFLCVGERPVPDYIGRLETLAVDWTAISAAVVARGGPQLPALEQRMKRSTRRPSVAEVLAAHPETVAMIDARYRRDFDLFYPDRPIPAD